MSETAIMLDPLFAPLLEGYDREELDEFPGAVYGLWSDLRIAYLNRAWFEFSARNEGEPSISRDWVLGTSILKAMPTEIARFYVARYGQCLADGEVLELEYECSTPDTYRRFKQFAYSLGSAGLLIMNSSVVERTHDPTERPRRDADDDAYRSATGFIVQCAYCRRARNFRDSGWDWVPDYVRKIPSETSHTYCPTCLAHYWSSSDAGDFAR